MPNVAEALEEQLAPEQLQRLGLLARASERHGAVPFLVGGTVRDLLLGQPTIDLDLSLVGASGDLAAALARELGGEVVARSRFGTSKLRLGDTVLDLATARKESYARPGALPTVVHGSIKDDLARRDFTINAMAVSLSSDRWGELLDDFDGRRDLERGLIRVLHASSFVDDATRILRAVRYMGRLGFGLEAGTTDLMARDLGYLETIKGDRVRHELERIFREHKAGAILELAQSLGVLTAIHPDLRLSADAQRRVREITVEPTVDNELLFVGMLTYAASSSRRPEIVTRLNMDRRWARVVMDTGSIRDALEELRSHEPRRSQVYRLLSGFDDAAVRVCALASSDIQAKGLLELYETELRDVKPLLDGDDLIELGAPEGPLIGELLDDLLTARLDGLLGTRDEEIAFVTRRIQEKG